MGWFDKNISVEFYLHELIKLLGENVNTHFIPDTLFGEAYTYSKKIREFIEYHTRLYKDSIHPKKLDILNNIIHFLEQVENLSRKKDKETLTKIHQISQKFTEYTNLGGAIYLFRHPDKPGKDLIERGYSISMHGISQVNEKGKMIASDILVAPIPARINIFSSELKRTQIFGKAIIHKSENAAKSHEKKILVYQHDANSYMLQLVFDDNGILVQGYKTNGEDKTYQEWMAKCQHDDRAYPKTETVDSCSKRIKEFFDHTQHMITENRINDIVIGITHSFVIDAFIDRHITPHKNKVIGTADFIKFECGKYYFEGKWY